VAYPASRTWYVSIVSRDNVDVGVEYRLPCCFAAVHANVKSLRLEFLLKYILDPPNEIKGVRVFFGGHLPERFNVPLWNNEGMTVRNRQAV